MKSALRSEFEKFAPEKFAEKASFEKNNEKFSYESKTQLLQPAACRRRALGPFPLLRLSADSTILLFGTVHHPVLTVLYHFLQERGRRRVVYLANEAFPNQPAFFYQFLNRDGQNGRIILEDGTNVDWDEVVSVGLDGFYVQPEGIENYPEGDREYLKRRAGPP